MVCTRALSTKHGVGCCRGAPTQRTLSGRTTAVAASKSANAGTSSRTSLLIWVRGQLVCPSIEKTTTVTTSLVTAVGLRAQSNSVTVVHTVKQLGAPVSTRGG